MGKNRQFYEKNIKVPTKFLQFAKKCFFEFLQFEKVSQMFSHSFLNKDEKILLYDKMTSQTPFIVKCCPSDGKRRIGIL